MCYEMGVWGQSPQNKRRTKCDTIIMHYALCIMHYTYKEHKMQKTTYNTKLTIIAVLVAIFFGVASCAGGSGGFLPISISGYFEYFTGLSCWAAFPLVLIWFSPTPKQGFLNGAIVSCLADFIYYLWIYINDTYIHIGSVYGSGFETSDCIFWIVVSLILVLCETIGVKIIKSKNKLSIWVVWFAFACFMVLAVMTFIDQFVYSYTVEGKNLATRTVHLGLEILVPIPMLLYGLRFLKKSEK
jgi:hypothetical protein